ncbi:DoxX family membrane protein [Sphingobacterium sp. DK4209]|uniref:DoxX family membrane protein n=1 Tax=Sphingobacterium zhuxiongii TaxID=2662364 RepID=A0A5Q0Q8F8_9SPHI|nr:MULTISPECIES: DoxX family protein [unclassified Sphingobacterium]MVZ64444.1 DoxX family membrane protein [Sphingobacterium sp. DK4209]QGA25783.1 DoxX family membrane protein [Sphingobacterium sp. dk4302]
MNLIERIEHWGDAHHPRWIDFVRISLGLVIFAKGVSFIMDRDSVAALIERTHFQLSIWSAVHYVVFAHIVGGIFIILGLRTRLAVALQIPILIGAVFFVNITRGFSFLNSEFWLSLVVLILLIYFLVVGSGPMSLDKEMDKPGYKRRI